MPEWRVRSLEFADELRTPDLERAAIEIERKIRTARPDVVALFVKPQAGKASSFVEQRASPARRREPPRKFLLGPVYSYFDRSAISSERNPRSPT